MTPSLALLVNTPPPSAPSSSASSASASSGSSQSSDFSTPLQQAYQQQSAARQVTPRPTNGNNTSTNASQVPSSSSAAQAATASSATSSSTPATSKGTAWNPAQAQGSQKDSDKPAAADPNAPQDPAAAMLALLGQSIPANAAPAPAPAGTTAVATAGAAAGIAAAGTSTTAAAGVTPGMQADADDLLDTAKSGDDAGDDALAALADDAGDDAPVATSVMGAVAKLGASTQGAQSSSPGNHASPLDALGAVTAPVMQVQANAAQPTATAHALTMQSSVGTPSFAQELGQHVAWLGGQEIKQARITLHPEDLGPLDVKVSVQQTHVDVSFIAQHPNAVHAVQQTLSQLDAMLAHHGLSLGQAQVGQGNTGQGTAGQGTANAGSTGSDANAGSDGDIAAVTAPVVQAVGLLDMFA